MTKLAAWLEYKGTHYHGWQNQENVSSTVQHCIERAISTVANEKIDVICAGRTDKGVHATGQVIHFDTTSQRKLHEWLFGSNSYLPNDIRIKWFKEVEEDFHARFSAISRRYCYVIANQRTAPGLFHDYLTWIPYPLDISRMQQAAQYLLGEHDFTSFRASQCQAHSPIRTINHLNIKQNGQFIAIDIAANGFLHHMVRNIAGVLLAIGSGKMPPNWADEVLKATDRKAGDITARANGLYLIHVEYPAVFNVDNTVQFPFSITLNE